MSKNKYEEKAQQILELVGGRENVTYVTHCVTRLRFTLKDESLVNQDAIKAIPGILGCQFTNSQFQVIVGPTVNNVYEETLKLTGGEEAKSIEKPKGKRSIKTILGEGLATFTSCITPVLPVIVCAGMIKMITSVFGPALLGWLPAESGLYTILSFAGDAGFYFLPVFLGFSTAKKFNLNPLIGMLFGAILVHPSFVEFATTGTALDFLGLPVTPVPYAMSVLPVVLIVIVASYIEKFFKKFIPDSLQLILVNTLTVLIMLPIALCILGPLGYILSGYISAFFMFIHTVLGPFGIGIIAVLFLPLILTGMHHAVNMAAVVTLMTTGYESVVWVAATAAVVSVIGANLAFMFKAKKKENKSLAATCTVMQAVAGIVEPTLFGIFLPYKKVMLGQAIGAFCGAVVMGFLGCKAYAITGSNLLILVGYLGGNGGNNFLFACIGSVVAIIVAFVAVYVLGFEEK